MELFRALIARNTQIRSEVTIRVLCVDVVARVRVCVCVCVCVCTCECVHVSAVSVLLMQDARCSPKTVTLSCFFL